LKDHSEGNGSFEQGAIAHNYLQRSMSLRVFSWINQSDFYFKLTN